MIIHALTRVDHLPMPCGHLPKCEKGNFPNSENITINDIKVANVPNVY